MIDWHFIDELEGGLILKGYVPDEHSGVTIADGVDLGYLTPAELASLPDGVRETLRPYAHARGAKARALLAAHPLVLLAGEAEAVMAQKRADMTNTVRLHYRIGAHVPFDPLPEPAQTVIMSVTWQYGDPWQDRKCGTFWQIACEQDWRRLAEQLRDFPDRRFMTRRRKEADYLERGMFSGPTPRPVAA